MEDRAVDGSASRPVRKRTSVAPVFFNNSAEFRAWLGANYDSASELIVGFYKVGSGRPSMTWPESVDEALCFGWIDGVRKRVDDDSYQIRFSPRRQGSIWSAVNVAKVEKLLAEGRMRPSGLQAFERRSDKRTGIYSFEQQSPVALTEPEMREFRKNKRAWRYFESLPPGYRKTVTFWVVSAKHPGTRARRLAQLVEACAENRRLLK